MGGKKKCYNYSLLCMISHKKIETLFLSAHFIVTSRRAVPLSFCTARIIPNKNTKNNPKCKTITSLNNSKLSRRRA